MRAQGPASGAARYADGNGLAFDVQMIATETVDTTGP